MISSKGSVLSAFVKHSFKASLCERTRNLQFALKNVLEENFSRRRGPLLVVAGVPLRRCCVGAAPFFFFLMVLLSLLVVLVLALGFFVFIVVCFGCAEEDDGTG